MIIDNEHVRLFGVLWVTKLIDKHPMYAVLDKDTIKNEILPHLSVAKRGYMTKSCFMERVNAILYKLKTDSQYFRRDMQKVHFFPVMNP